MMSATRRVIAFSTERQGMDGAHTMRVTNGNITIAFLASVCLHVSHRGLDERRDVGLGVIVEDLIANEEASSVGVTLEGVHYGLEPQELGLSPHWGGLIASCQQAICCQ